MFKRKERKDGGYEGIDDQAVSLDLGRARLMREQALALTRPGASYGPAVVRLAARFAIEEQRQRLADGVMASVTSAEIINKRVSDLRQRAVAIVEAASTGNARIPKPYSLSRQMQMPVERVQGLLRLAAFPELQGRIVIQGTGRPSAVGSIFRERIPFDIGRTPNETQYAERLAKVTTGNEVIQLTTPAEIDISALYAVADDVTSLMHTATNTDTHQIG